MRVRLSQSVQKTLQLGKDLMFLLINDDNKTAQYSKQLMCEDTGISYEEPSAERFFHSTAPTAPARFVGIGQCTPSIWKP